MLFQSMEVHHSIYQIEWNVLDVKVQKLLMFMMNRAIKPIRFNVGYFIPMNIGSFINVKINMNILQ